MGIYENIKIFRPVDLSKDITYKIDKIIKKRVNIYMVMQFGSHI